MAYNIADLYEHTADVVGDRTALVDGPVRLTYAQLDMAANRFGDWLRSSGVEAGQHVGIYGQNSHRWLIAMLGTLKIRAVPININYRYVADELAYLVDNAEIVACIYDRQYAPRLVEVAHRAPKMSVLVHIDDGSDADALPGSACFDEAVAAGSPDRHPWQRSGDDRYVIYTGGTTGMPKGVVWRSEDIFFALGQGIDALTRERVPDEWFRSRQAAATEQPLVFGLIPPLMHGAAQIATLSQWFIGSTVVLAGAFDSHRVWDVIEAERVNSILLTGDAVARPMIDALEAAPERWDLGSLVSVSSSAALFSQSVKDRYFDAFPDLILTDSTGSTESGFTGIGMASRGAQPAAGGPTVAAGDDVIILDEDLVPIPADDGRTGVLARGGNIPLGYFNDPEKTAATFVTAADGKRYVISGDSARWAAPGQITMLGRGSVCINSGGEKIFPEEVEQALKAHPLVHDCTVVGVPDERWGQRVAAVVAYVDGESLTLDELTDHARNHIAGYKVPRELHVVDQIVRSPAGKPDYRWATSVALGGATSVESFGRAATPS